MATTWLFMIVLHILCLSSHCLLIPDCQQRRISFIAGPEDVDIPCGAHKVNVTFRCEYRGSRSKPVWLINSITYSSVELPADYSYDNWSLTVSSVHNKNNTSYQCQLLRHEEDEFCAYRSTIGHLIIRCKAILFNLHCLPFYNLTTYNLDRIDTTFSQVSIGSGTMYHIKYLDSASGNICHSTNIPASSCVNGSCKDIFNISSSLCPNTTNISTTISFANDSLGNVIASDPIKVDAENKFVGVSINISESRIKINCTFFDQPKEANKYCGVRYGPSCQNLTLLPAKASVDYSKSVIIDMMNDIQTVSKFNICFSITASNDTKTVNLEGIYFHSKSAGSSVETAKVVTTSILILIWFAFIDMNGFT